MNNEWDPSHGSPQCRCVYAAIEVAADPERVAEAAQSNASVCLTVDHDPNAKGLPEGFGDWTLDRPRTAFAHLGVPYTEEEDEAWKALDAKR